MKRKKSVTRTFTVTECRGNLPYTVMWISLAEFPSVKHFGTLEEASAHKKGLRKLGREACILINLKECDPF
jgi:hypothetical protein